MSRYRLLRKNVCGIPRSRISLSGGSVRRGGELRVGGGLDTARVDDVPDLRLTRGFDDIAVMEHALLAEGAGRDEQQLTDIAKRGLKGYRIRILAASNLNAARCKISDLSRVAHDRDNVVRPSATFEQKANGCAPKLTRSASDADQLHGDLLSRSTRAPFSAARWLPVGAGSTLSPRSGE